MPPPQFWLVLALLVIAIFLTTIPYGWWAAAPLLTLAGGMTLDEDW